MGYYKYIINNKFIVFNEVLYVWLNNNGACALAFLIIFKYL